MDQRTKGLLAALETRRKGLDAGRPLPHETLRSLRDWLRVELTYSSNAIEGNTLTLVETRVVLEGLTVGGKPLRDHLEAIDHADAFDYLCALVDRAEPLTETVLRSLHALVLQRSKPQYAGRYRDIPVAITGTDFIPPPPIEVPSRMADLFQWLRKTAVDLNPVAGAAQFHERLVSIHPFVDGNGRTARLAANLLLMAAGYPPAVITPQDRPAYYDALRAAQVDGELDPIVRLFIAAVERALIHYERLHRGV